MMNLTLPPKRHMKKGRSAPQKFPKCYNVNVPFLFKMPPKMGGSSKKDSKFQGEILPIYIFLSYRKTGAAIFVASFGASTCPPFLRSSNPGTCPYLLPWHLGSIFGSTPVGGIPKTGGGGRSSTRKP